VKINDNQEIICGINIIESILTTDINNTEELFVLDSKSNSRIRSISSQAKKRGLKVSKKNKEFFLTYCKNQNHQGLALLCNKRKEEDESFLDNLLKKDSLLFLVLDHITDPHNVGACLRNAAAVQVDAVIVPKNRSCHLTPTVRKISSGGSELIPFIVVTNLVRVLRKMKLSEVEILGADTKGKDNYKDIILGKKNALIIGSENKGLKELTRKNCDRLIRIDMPGDIESLNNSVTSGILLFEFIRNK
tara:strand:+ start:408 stop:1148 length:741 start_codon:yes stop_codon:yes gene_type:complete